MTDDEKRPQPSLWSRLTANPVGFIRRMWFKFVAGPAKYRRGEGYDAARYWEDRFSQYGRSLRGAGHENGLRPGTENVASIVGLGEACRIAQHSMGADTPRIKALRDELWDRLQAGPSIAAGRSSTLPESGRPFLQQTQSRASSDSPR